MSPTTATPRSASEANCATVTAASTTSREPGRRGSQRRSARTAARLTSPTATVSPCTSGTCWTTPTVLATNSPEVAGIPSSAGTCPAMMVSASPTMKPFSTGSLISVAMKPSRSSPAAIPTSPTVSASAAV